MSELGDANFSLLVDESRDVSVKEQMAVMVRLVILSQLIILVASFIYYTLTTYNIWSCLQVCEHKRRGFGEIAWCYACC